MKIRFGHAGALLVLVLVALFAYGKLRHAPFVYDDLWFIVRNDALATAPLPQLVTNPALAADPRSQLGADVFRPLTTLSFGIDRRLWGLSARPYHLENIALQVFAAFFVYLALSCLVEGGLSALLGALMFLLHPAQSQAVAWVSQRSSVLSGAFGCAALLAFVSRRGRPAVRAGLGLVLWALALLSKESAIVIPLLLATLALVLPGTVLPGGARREKAAAVLGFVLIGGVYLAVRAHLIGLSQNAADDTPLAWRLALGARAFPVFVGKIFWPVGLRASYGIPEFDPYWILAGAVLLISLAGLAWGLRRRAPSVALATFWVLIGALPFLQILPVRAFFADRFLYFALLGPALAVAWLARSRFFRPAALILTAVFALACRRAVEPWMSNEALWAHVVQWEHTNAFAQASLGEVATDPALKERAGFSALLNQPAQGIRVRTMLNLALLYRAQGRSRRSQVWARMALSEEPQNPLARALLAN